jgi:hypothetical protein
MTIPIICILKAIVEIPANLMMFYQSKSFAISMAGIYSEYFFAKGWTSSAILMLKEVVDPSISYLSISFFILTTSVTTMLSSNLFGQLTKYLQLKPIDDPDLYGNYMAIFTITPIVLCIPFFLYGGCVMRNKKRAKVRNGEETRKEGDARVSHFIKSFINFENGNDGAAADFGANFELDEIVVSKPMG